MTPRGPYAKGVAKREEILASALDVISAQGYSRATVRQVAESVGLSQNGLLHYFGSKDALFTEVLRRRDELLAAQFYDELGDRGTLEGLVDFVRRDTAVPGLVQLHVRLSNEATEPDHPAHEFFRERYRVQREQWTRVLGEAQRAGALAGDLAPDRLAVLAIAVVEGLHAQWLYDTSLDVAGALAAWLAELGSAAPRPT